MRVSGEPPSAFRVLDFVLLVSWAQSPSLFPDKLRLLAAFYARRQPAGEAASGIGGQPSAASRFVFFIDLLLLRLLAYL